MALVVLTALMTVAGNLLMREGVVRAGGFSLALTALVASLRNLALQPLFLAGFGLYGAASLVWFAIVSTENLNTAYPLLISLTFILVTLGATVLFHESMSWQKAAGLAMLLVGIALVGGAK